MQEKFEYVYKAPTEEERREIDSIRRQYLAGEEKTESKMERLRRLDGRVKNTAVCLGLTFGIVACLLFGLGLALVLEWNLWWAGVPVSVIGGVSMPFAYPLYKKGLAHGKKKYGEEIIRLTDELLKTE